jgi:hypothetical protein
VSCPGFFFVTVNALFVRRCLCGEALRNCITAINVYLILGDSAIRHARSPDSCHFQVKQIFPPPLGRIMRLGSVGGNAMNNQADSLTRLREEARLRRQMALQRSPNPSSLVPQIKMIVSDWYTDELGNQTRVIKAREQ